MNTESNSQLLISKISDKTATIGIIGMGYVGLPLAIEFARTGFPTVGFDIDNNKVSKINNGESYIKHITPNNLEIFTNSSMNYATTDFSLLAIVDCVIICVPHSIEPVSGTRYAVYQIYSKYNFPISTTKSTYRFREHYLSWYHIQSGKRYFRAIRPESRQRFLSGIFSRKRRSWK